MKKFLNLLFLFAFIVLPLSLQAAEVVDAENSSPEKVDVGIVLRGYVDQIEYLNEKYPDDLIFEDFSGDIARFYPHFAKEQLFKQSQTLRTAVRLYRTGINIYEQYKEMMLVPSVPTLVLADDEYEKGEVPVYQDVGYPMVINDFKKVISYSSEASDISASKAKNIADRVGDKGVEKFNELEEAFQKLEFKKIFLYGLLYDSPFEDKRGIGEWNESGYLKARLLSESKNLGNAETLKAALQIIIPRGYVLLAEPLLNHSGLQVSFDDSTNLREVTDNKPVPRRLVFANNDVIGYMNNVVIPLSVRAKDWQKKLELKALLKFTLCGEDVCKKYSLQPELKLEAGDFAESKVANYLKSFEIMAPEESSSQLKIIGIVVEKGNEQQKKSLLRVTLEAKKTPNNFNIFINNDEGIKFQRPLIRIDGKQIIARFLAIDEKAKLIGKKFTITAKVSEDISLRQTLPAEAMSMLDIQTKSLNLGLIMLGILGGFLLNLMPCVFPVLSLKIMAFTKFGGLNEQKIRLSFYYNILGILAAFVLLIIMLISLKNFGYAVGWGMQFQNIYFLVMIIFVVGAFLAQVFGWLNFSSSNLVAKLIYKSHGQENMSHFLTGLFLVLLATPCTAPYLGTALGFALAGSVVDIIVVMMAVALGLALPYILLAFVPGLARLVPHPGPWMLKLNFLMILMLILTMIWLLSILFVQTSWGTVWRLGIYIFLFFCVLCLRKYILEMVDSQKESVEAIIKVKRFFNLVSLFLIISLIALSMWSAKSSYNNKRGLIALSHYNQMVDNQLIQQNLDAGRLVLLRIGADWCLTCKYNDFTVFSSPLTKDMMNNYGVEVIDIDWTNYNEQVLAFMEKYGRKGLPFNVLYSPRIPEGMVLPELVNEKEFRELVENLRY